MQNRGCDRCLLMCWGTGKENRLIQKELYVMVTENSSSVFLTNSIYDFLATKPDVYSSNRSYILFSERNPAVTVLWHTQILLLQYICWKSLGFCSGTTVQTPPSSKGCYITKPEKPFHMVRWDAPSHQTSLAWCGETLAMVLHNPNRDPRAGLANPLL